MKKYSWLLAIIIAFAMLFTFASCKNDDPKPEPETPGPTDSSVTFVRSGPGSGTAEVVIGSGAAITIPTAPGTTQTIPANTVVVVTLQPQGEAIVGITDSQNAAAALDADSKYTFTMGSTNRTISVTFAQPGVQYNIVLPQGLTGAVVKTDKTNNKSEALHQVEVTVDLTAPYYIKTSVLVTTGEEPDVEVIARGGRKFSFMMPAKDVKIVLEQADLDQFVLDYDIIDNFNTPGFFRWGQAHNDTANPTARATAGYFQTGGGGSGHQYWPEFCTDYSVSGNTSFRLNYNVSNAGFRFGKSALAGEALANMDDVTHVIFYARLSAWPRAGEPSGNTNPTTAEFSFCAIGHDATGESRPNAGTKGRFAEWFKNDNSDANTWKRIEIPIADLRLADKDLGAFYLYLTGSRATNGSISFDGVNGGYNGVGADGSEAWVPATSGTRGEAIWIDMLGVKKVPTTVVTTSIIKGVVAPVQGVEPVTEITPAAGEYTGGITWQPALLDGKFAPGTSYTATIRLIPEEGKNVRVDPDFFSIENAGGATVTSVRGVITAVYPATDTVPVSMFKIAGMHHPIAGNTPVAGPITGTIQYDGTLVWTAATLGNLDNDGHFKTSTTYTADLTINTKQGYTLEGINTQFNADHVASIVRDGETNKFLVTFDQTRATAVIPVTIDTIAVDIPATGAIMNIVTLTNAQWTGAVTWNHGLTAGGKFLANTDYTATIVLTLVDEEVHTFEGLPSTFFKVTGSKTPATGSLDAQSGKYTVTATFETTEAADNETVIYDLVTDAQLDQFLPDRLSDLFNGQSGGSYVYDAGPPQSLTVSGRTGTGQGLRLLIAPLLARTSPGSSIRIEYGGFITNGGTTAQIARLRLEGNTGAVLASQPVDASDGSFMLKYETTRKALADVTSSISISLGNTAVNEVIIKYTHIRIIEIAPDPDAGCEICGNDEQCALDIAAVQLLVEGMTGLEANANSQTAAKTAAQAAVNNLTLNGVTATVQDAAGFSAPTDSGDGVYPFTVKLEKGCGDEVTTGSVSMVLKYVAPFDPVTVWTLAQWITASPTILTMTASSSNHRPMNFNSAALAPGDARSGLAAGYENIKNGGIEIIRSQATVQTNQTTGDIASSAGLNIMIDAAQPEHLNLNLVNNIYEVTISGNVIGTPPTGGLVQLRNEGGTVFGVSEALTTADQAFSFTCELPAPNIAHIRIGTNSAAVRMDIFVNEIKVVNKGPR